MKATIALVSGVCLLACFSYALAAGAAKNADDGQLLAHSVYFSLKEPSADAKQTLVDSCKKHLSQHPGVVFFSAGTPCDEIKGPFNDRDFDVVLLMVFADHAALHTYAGSESHQKFLADNSGALKKVRIFDADVDRVGVPDDSRLRSSRVEARISDAGRFVSAPRLGLPARRIRRRR